MNNVCNHPIEKHYSCVIIIKTININLSMLRRGMEIFFGVIFIFLGIAMIAKPEAFLYFQDIFRLKGERTYSEVAIIIQRLAGVLAIILGIVFMFIGF